MPSIVVTFLLKENFCLISAVFVHEKAQVGLSTG